jgi:PBSX family phage portal protein
VGSAETVVKLQAIGTAESTSQALGDVDGEQSKWTGTGAIDPPFNPSQLLATFERSSSLRQNVDAYATNIDGFGHRLEPVIDLDSKEADTRIAHAMFLERQRAVDKGDATEALMPTDEEVAERKLTLVEDQRLERSRLELFLEFCCADDLSFTSFRKQLRHDLETLGNAYFEVLRDGTGQIAELVYLPSFTMRVTERDKTPTQVTVKRRISELSYEELERPRRLRRFVQKFENATTYFKEFGDPRLVSRKTGEAKDKLEEEDDSPATEVVHLRIHSSRSAYGIPRWIGNLTAVMGTREAEEVNLSYFNNKSVPPLALLVSGGTVSDDTITRLEKFVDQEIRGKGNFHKILILEAAPADGASLDSAARSRIELKPLTDAQQKDALFLDYDARNQDKIGMAFRLPRMLRGDIRDFNRSTAEAALDYAEQQVFGPERQEFDHMVNRRLLTDLDVRHWKFCSRAPELRDAEQLAKIVKDLVLAGVLTPEEGRQLAEKIFNREFVRIDEEWTKQPIAMTLAGIPWEGSSRLTPFTGERPGIGQERAGYGDLDADGVTDAEVAEATGLTANVTPTALSSVLTVNEVRLANGFDRKLMPDGSEDPDGDMVISEYVSRRRANTTIAFDAHKLLALRKSLVDAEARAAAQSAYDQRKQWLEEGPPAP